jgi:hypothetical protein
MLYFIPTEIGLSVSFPPFFLLSTSSVTYLGDSFCLNGLPFLLQIVAFQEKELVTKVTKKD